MNAQTSQPTQRPTNAGQVVTARKSLIEYFDSQAVVARVEQAVPRGTDFAWLLATFKLALHQNPRLQQCTQVSLYAALMKCAQAGLVPDGRHVHLIPYADVVQVIFDYKGLADLVFRSGEVSSIEADVVYEADDFEWSRGHGGRLFHKPELRRERGQAYCAYSYVVMKDGRPGASVMRRDEIEAVRDNSQGWQAFIAGKAKQSPWDPEKSAWPEMWKKTVFRRHQKLLPFSAQLRKTIESDDEPLNTEEARFAEAKRIAAPAKSFLGAPDLEENGSTAAPVEVEPPKAKKRPVEPTPQDALPVTATDDAYYAELARVLKAQGMTLGQFLHIAESGGMIPDATSLATIEDIPLSTVKELLSNKEAFVKALNAAKA